MAATLTAIFGAAVLAASVASAQDATSETIGTKEVKNVVYKVVDGREIKLNLFLPTKATVRSPETRLF
ncbi:MAG: hypothetical protein IJE77_04285 [Thermoguttaceae bacterium]|nr:hypothetical protein [Thermoguttaceae bacterium]MBQ9801273.1 hypothetical protein [Thermoguttaceae bacterium]